MMSLIERGKRVSIAGRRCRDEIAVGPVRPRRRHLKGIANSRAQSSEFSQAPEARLWRGCDFPVKFVGREKRELTARRASITCLAGIDLPARAVGALTKR